MQIMKTTTILVAGGTGDLGGRIIKALLKRGADVRAIVRSSTDDAKVQKLEKQGVKVIRVNMSDISELTQACMGASCLISALQGLHDVIVEMQSVLLDAAVAAGVPRFIPSDFSSDFTKLSVGDNRNFDLRREFHERLNKASIAATSIFNGAFTDLLTGQMPLILFKLKRVLYWGDADQRMDFTTMDDTAAFTASAALDPSTPRFLRIAGDQLSARELTAVVSEVTGKKFRLFRAGGLGMLSTLIKVVRTVAPGEKEIFPAWQGMQYMRNMIDGRAKLEPLDNERYPDIKWTSAKELLAAHR
jgi:nucleoside-diphosphate-sugar epimerase